MTMNNFKSGCLICGEKLIIENKAKEYTCFICNKKFISSTICKNNHYVCDDVVVTDCKDELIFLHSISPFLARDPDSPLFNFVFTGCRTMKRLLSPWGVEPFEPITPTAPEPSDGVLWGCVCQSSSM